MIAIVITIFQRDPNKKLSDGTLLKKMRMMALKQVVVTEDASGVITIHSEVFGLW